MRGKKGKGEKREKKNRREEEEKSERKKYGIKAILMSQVWYCVNQNLV